MAARFSELVIDCHDTGKVARFWAAVLDYQLTSELCADEGMCWEAKSTDASQPSLVFVPVPEPKTVKLRLHIDVSPVGGATRDEEVERILALGATPADVGQGDQSWVVLADVEGNEFCVLGPHEPGAGESSLVLARPSSS